MMSRFGFAFGIFGMLVASFGIPVLRVTLRRRLRRSAILCGVLLVVAGALPLLDLLRTGVVPFNEYMFGFGVAGCLT